MSDLSIEDATRLKKALETDIEKSIRAFELVTGLIISALRITRYTGTTVGGRESSIFEVSVEVKL